MNMPLNHNMQMRDVPKIYDGGDVVTGDDISTYWCGEVMCCLECREVKPMRLGMTATYLLAQLECGECGEPFAEVWV